MIEAAIIAQLVAQGRLQAAVHGSLIRERGEVYDRSARARSVHHARTRWLQDHDAEASFPCGVVRTDTVGFPAEVRDRRTELAVIAAVLPDSLTFLVDPPEMFPAPDPVEAGSVPREAILGAEVRTLEGDPVPEPLAESLDPEPDVIVVATWDERGETREQALRFRSAWLAWQAARRLRAAARPPGS